MSETTHRQQQAKLLRLFRKIHRTTGALLFVFFLFISISGLLLGWKKNSNGMLLAKSYTGTSTELKDWISLDSLYKNACAIVHDSIDKNNSLEVERIDVRQEKGMVKFVFAEDFIGVQLDGATGKLLHIEQRRADYIEKIHDGSILDYYFKTNNGSIKLVYTTIMGLALLLFTITGFWLWYGPKKMRKAKKEF